MAASMIKGSTMKLRVQFVRERWGEAGLSRVLARLDPDVGATLLKPLPINWYPLALNARFDELVCEELARGDERIYETMGEYSAESFAQQIYTTYFTEVTAERFLNLTTELYKHHYQNAGARRNVPQGAGSMELWVEGSPEAYVPNCMSNVGFIRKSMQLLGIPGVACREIQCAARSGVRGGTCKALVAWRP